MNEQEFLKKISDQFDETNPAEFVMNTQFKELEEWSSLLSLSIIAMCDEEYGVKISGDDIKKSTTIEELYKIVLDRK